jgi:hypothetical protein
VPATKSSAMTDGHLVQRTGVQAATGRMMELSEEEVRSRGGVIRSFLVAWAAHAYPPPQRWRSGVMVGYEG